MLELGFEPRSIWLKVHGLWTEEQALWKSTVNSQCWATRTQKSGSLVTQLLESYRINTLTTSTDTAKVHCSTSQATLSQQLGLWDPVRPCEMSRENFISSIYNWRNYGFVNTDNFQSCMSDLEMMELGLNFYVYEWNKTGVREVAPGSLSHWAEAQRGLCSTTCQHLLSKVEFPRKEEFPKPSTITQSYNFKKASAFKVSALSWVPQGTHVKPRVRAPNSLDHHPLLRFQVYQLAGASGHRHLELHFHLSSCSRETRTWRSFI